MINLLRVENVEVQRSSDSIKIAGETGKTSDSACVFESILSVNQEIKNAMIEEMKRRGLTDESSLRKIINRQSEWTQIRSRHHEKH